MTSKRKTCARRAIIITLTVLLAIAAAFLIYVSDYYRADEAANAALLTDDSVTVAVSDGRVVFTPSGEPSAGLIFYPGGKVEYTAYAPLMHRLAEDGIQCVLLKMPFNLAVLDVNAADGIPEEFPEIGSWYIGGHSLGGTMVASCAAGHPGDFDGLILLASYSTAGLSDSGLRVLSVYGSEDGVLNMEQYEKYRASLPDSAQELVISGGNHAGFGSYGAQDGDGVPTISAEEQTDITAAAAAEFITS